MFEELGYEVGASLGCDCWGELFSAVYRSHGSAVLLRRFDAELSSNDRAWKIVESQLRASSALDVPGIVPVLDWGRHGGAAFAAMRMPGGTRLADVRAPLGEERALAVFRNLVGAVAAASRRGVLHLGLSPSCVWVDGESVDVIDFGLWYAAREFPGCARPDELFLAPEQVEDSTGGSPSDAYSLGLLFVHLSFGLEAAREIAAGGSPPDGTPALVARCLRTNPASRPASPAELLPPAAGRECAGDEDEPCPVCEAKSRIERAAAMRAGRAAPARNIVSCVWFLMIALAIATLIVWWLALR